MQESAKLNTGLKKTKAKVHVQVSGTEQLLNYGIYMQLTKFYRQNEANKNKV